MAQQESNNDEIEIYGKITIEFSGHESLEIKENSYLYLSFQDCSLMDAPSKDHIKPIKIIINPGTFKKDEFSINYSFKCERPKDYGTNLSTCLSATLNNGWDRNDTNNEWIRQGDALTTSTNNIVIDGQSKRFEYDLKLQQYD